MDEFSKNWKYATAKMPNSIRPGSGDRFGHVTAVGSNGLRIPRHPAASSTSRISRGQSAPQQTGPANSSFSGAREMRSGPSRYRSSDLNNKEVFFDTEAERTAYDVEMRPLKIMDALLELNEIKSEKIDSLLAQQSDRHLDLPRAAANHPLATRSGSGGRVKREETRPRSPSIDAEREAAEESERKAAGNLNWVEKDYGHLLN